MSFEQEAQQFIDKGNSTRRIVREQQEKYEMYRQLPPHMLAAWIVYLEARLEVERRG